MRAAAVPSARGARLCTVHGQTEAAKTAQSEIGHQAHGEERLDQLKGRQARCEDDQAGHRPVTLPMHRGKDYGVSLTWSIFKSASLE